MKLSPHLFDSGKWPSRECRTCPKRRWERNRLPRPVPARLSPLLTSVPFQGKSPRCPKGQPEDDNGSLNGPVVLVSDLHNGLDTDVAGRVIDCMLPFQHQDFKVLNNRSRCRRLLRRSRRRWSLGRSSRGRSRRCRRRGLSRDLGVCGHQH